MASDRHTLTTYVWLTGVTAVKHFARFDVFLGDPRYHKRWHLGGAVIRLATQNVPASAVMRVSCGDTTKQNASGHIEGLNRYRHGASSARQDYRTLRGLHFVSGVMPLPLKRWPGHLLSIPVGLALYLKAPQAPQHNVLYRSRSQVARDLLDFLADQVPGGPSGAWLTGARPPQCL